MATWDNNRGIAVKEFFDSFVKEGFDISPLIMPRADLLRGDRIFSFLSNRSKTFKGLPGLCYNRLLYIGRRSMGILEFALVNRNGGFGTDGFC